MTYWDPQNAPDVDSEQSDEEYVDMLIRQNKDNYEVSLVRPPQDRDDLSAAEQAAFDAYVDEDTDRGDR